jgi:hypothetical protein
VLAVLRCFGHSPPDLEVLHSIAIFILRGALPCNNIRSEGREAQFEDIGSGERSDNLAGGGVDDRNPARKRVSMFSIGVFWQCGLLFG